jgi:hypothetical protein
VSRGEAALRSRRDLAALCLDAARANREQAPVGQGAAVAEPGVEVRLLLGVARLGEADLFGWWRTRGLGDAGRYVLGQGLPRTWILAALEGDVLSAAVRHEDVFRRSDALHLFSDELPGKRLALSWLRERKVEGEADGLLAELRAWSRESALVRVREWAGVSPSAGEELGQVRRLGAVSVGELEDEERTRELVRALAASYTYDPADLRFPYFDRRP